MVNYPNFLATKSAVPHLRPHISTIVVATLIILAWYYPEKEAIVALLLHVFVYVRSYMRNTTRAKACGILVFIIVAAANTGYYDNTDPVVGASTLKAVHYGVTEPTISPFTLLALLVNLKAPLLISFHFSRTTAWEYFVVPVITELLLKTYFSEILEVMLCASSLLMGIGAFTTGGFLDGVLPATWNIPSLMAYVFGYFLLPTAALLTSTPQTTTLSKMATHLCNFTLDILRVTAETVCSSWIAVLVYLRACVAILLHHSWEAFKQVSTMAMGTSVTGAAVFVLYRYSGTFAYLAHLYHTYFNTRSDLPPAKALTVVAVTIGAISAISLQPDAALLFPVICGVLILMAFGAWSLSTTHLSVEKIASLKLDMDSITADKMAVPNSYVYTVPLVTSLLESDVPFLEASVLSVVAVGFALLPFIPQLGIVLVLSGGPLGAYVAIHFHKIRGIRSKHSYNLGSDFATAPTVQEFKGKMEDGIYRVVSVGAYSRDFIGTGFVYKGIFHTNYHVTSGEDIRYQNQLVRKFEADRQRDVITYGGPWQCEALTGVSPGDKVLMKTIHVGEVSKVTSHKVFAAKAHPNCVYQLDHLAIAYDLPKGHSGSPIYTYNGTTWLPVGIYGSGWEAAWSGLGFVSSIAATENTGPAPAKAHQIDTSPGVEWINIHPGGGKTRVIARNYFKKAILTGKSVVLLAPTRVVANEASAALKDQGAVYGKANHMRDIMCHATYLKHVMKGNPAMYSLYIFDEAHYQDAASIALRAVLTTWANANLCKVVFMTATPPSPISTAYNLDSRDARNSNHPITDIPLGDNDVKNGEPTQAFISGLKGRTVVFVSSRQEADTLAIRYKGLSLHSKNYSSNHVSVPNHNIIVTTDISELGANYDVDNCVDLGKRNVPMCDSDSSGQPSVTVRTVNAPTASIIQRRGRVGRSKPGNYYHFTDVTPCDDLTAWAVYQDAAILYDNVDLRIAKETYPELQHPLGSFSIPDAAARREFHRRVVDMDWTPFFAHMAVGSTDHNAICGGTDPVVSPSGLTHTWHGSDVKPLFNDIRMHDWERYLVSSIPTPSHRSSTSVRGSPAWAASFNVGPKRATAQDHKDKGPSNDFYSGATTSFDREPRHSFQESGSNQHYIPGRYPTTEFRSTVRHMQREADRDDFITKGDVVGYGDTPGARGLRDTCIPSAFECIFKGAECPMACEIVRKNVEVFQALSFLAAAALCYQVYSQFRKAAEYSAYNLAIAAVVVAYATTENQSQISLYATVACVVVLGLVQGNGTRSIVTPKIIDLISYVALCVFMLCFFEAVELPRTTAFINRFVEASSTSARPTVTYFTTSPTPLVAPAIIIREVAEAISVLSFFVACCLPTLREMHARRAFTATDHTVIGDYNGPASIQAFAAVVSNFSVSGFAIGVGLSASLMTLMVAVDRSDIEVRMKKNKLSAEARQQYNSNQEPIDAVDVYSSNNASPRDAGCGVIAVVIAAAFVVALFAGNSSVTATLVVLEAYHILQWNLGGLPSTAVLVSAAAFAFAPTASFGIIPSIIWLFMYYKSAGVRSNNTFYYLGFLTASVYAAVSVIAYFFPDGVRSSFKSPADTATNWRVRLDRLTLDQFNVYKSNGIIEMEGNASKAGPGHAVSRGYYKMQWLCSAGLRLSGKVIDLGAGRGGWTQYAVQQPDVTAATMVSLCERGHEIMRDFDTKGHNLADKKRADAFKFKPYPVGTILCDIGESKKSEGIMAQSAMDVIDLVTKWKEVSPDAKFCFKVLVPYHRCVLERLRTFQKRWGGTLLRCALSRNSTCEMYFVSIPGRRDLWTLVERVLDDLIYRFDNLLPTHYWYYHMLSMGERRPYREPPTMESTDDRVNYVFKNGPRIYDGDHPYRYWRYFGSYPSTLRNAGGERISALFEHVCWAFARIDAVRNMHFTDVSPAAIQGLFRRKIDVPQFATEAVAALRHHTIMRWILKHMHRSKQSRMCTKEEFIANITSRKSVGAYTSELVFEDAIKAVNDDAFWDIVDKERSLHLKGKCEICVYNVMGKREKKVSTLGKTPSARIIWYMHLACRFLEFECLGYLNEDHFLHRDNLPSAVGGVGVQYLGHIMKPIFDATGTAYAEDTASWDTRITAEDLKAEAQVAEFAEGNHKRLIEFTYKVPYGNKIALVPRRATQGGVIDVIGNVSQRGSGEVVTYSMNTITNSALQLGRIIEAEGAWDSLHDFLEEHGADRLSTMVVAGDDVVVFTTNANYPSALEHIHALGKPRKDMHELTPSRPIRIFDHVSFCSHHYHPVHYKGTTLVVPCRPQVEIMGRWRVQNSASSDDAVCGALLKANVQHGILFFFHRRDIRKGALAICSSIPADIVPLGKTSYSIHSKHEWMTTEDILEVWNNVWLRDNPYVTDARPARTFRELPYIPKTIDAMCGSLVDTSDRTLWSNSLPTKVREVRQKWAAHPDYDSFTGFHDYLSVYPEYYGISLNPDRPLSRAPIAIGGVQAL